MGSRRRALGYVAIPLVVSRSRFSLGYMNVRNRAAVDERITHR